MNNQDGLDAYWKEWTNLESKAVYCYSTTCEWSKVSREARDQGKEVHLAFLFGFMVQKGAEYEPGDPRKKYKYRVVLRGNDIKDQSFEVALFQEMATTPTTLEASRFCDLLGLLPGNATQGRDVEQAYLLAKMKGPATYVMLPKELWSDQMHYMRMPVVLLERALYGHPLAGAFWHQYCAKICKTAGFRLFSDNWPCCYWLDETCTMLIVYVDDMKMSGPILHLQHTLG